MNKDKSIPLLGDGYVFPDDESLYFDVTVQALGKGETAVEFRTRFNMALAMNHEQLLPALGSFENLFDWLIKKPTQIALTKFMEERFRRGLAAQKPAPSAETKKIPIAPVTTITPVPSKVIVTPGNKVPSAVGPVVKPISPATSAVAKPAMSEAFAPETPKQESPRPEQMPVAKVPGVEAASPEALPKAA